jgi:hypothetical protein
MTAKELTIEERIEGRLDHGITGELVVSDRAGGVGFVSMDQVMEFAKLMSISSIAVRKHLRGNVGACLAVCVQAIEWQMSPYAVANKSYSVNDSLAFEAQLIEAVILRRAPIKGRPKVEYTGEGDRRICRIWAELRSEPGEIVEYNSPEFSKITPKNSPLWKADPDQQQFYYSVRAWCRRHFPDVLLGVYVRDEMEDAEPIARVVSPKTLSARLDDLAKMPTPAPAEEPHDPETGEIISPPSSPQVATSPAAGQPAPASDPSQGIGQPGAGEAEPKTAAAYIQNTKVWIENLLDADAGLPRWETEKTMRNRLHLPPADRDQLYARLLSKLVSMRNAAKE